MHCRSSALVAAAFEQKVYPAFCVEQAVLQARQARHLQVSTNLLICSAKLQTIDDSPRRHKGRMIVFFG
jgi:hypothetical protein